MRTEPSRTFIGSVVCVDLVGYSLKPVARQGAVKAAFNEILARAIAHIPVDDRIILDTGDGAAITFLGDPEHALQVALALRDSFDRAGTPLREAEADRPVRIGINLGPVRPSVDMNGHMRLIGDGINGAERIAALALPGQITVSRSYHDVASRLTHEHAAYFEHLGPRADRNGQPHDVYGVKDAQGLAAASARSGDPDPREMTQVQVMPAAKPAAAAVAAPAPAPAPAPPAVAVAPVEAPSPAATAAPDEPAFVAFLRDGRKVGIAAGFFAAVIAVEAWVLARPASSNAPPKVAEAPPVAPVPVEPPAPVATAPVVSAPPASAPAVPAPAKEAPRAAAPKSDPPKSEAPKAEAPKPDPAKPPPQPPKSEPAKSPPAPPKGEAPKDAPRDAGKAKGEPAKSPAPRNPEPAAPPPRTEPAPAPEPVPAPPRPAEPAPRAEPAPPPPSSVVIVSRAPVAFPLAAAKEGIAAGMVRARLTINAEGRVVNIRVTESEPPRAFDREAIKSLEQWRFNPGADGRVHEVQLDFRR